MQDVILDIKNAFWTTSPFLWALITFFFVPQQSKIVK